jgi:hypothetical protein
LHPSTDEHVDSSSDLQVYRCFSAIAYSVMAALAPVLSIDAFTAAMRGSHVEKDEEDDEYHVQF